MAIIIGNSGDNTLSSKKRGDIIFGLDGDDTLIALHGFNILLGGDGEDRLTALSSFNILSGGAGNDTLRAEHGWNLLLGGDGDDTFSSSSDENILDGGDGDDLFSILGGFGNTVKGGSGRDTVSYADATQGIAVSLAAGTGTGTATLSGIENVSGGAGDDTIIGDDGDNVLQGGGGNDTIEGGAGNDIVDGGAGDDLIIGGTGAGDDVYDGGDGSDTVSYASTSQGVAANLASGIATGGEIGTDTLIDIENLIGGTGNDTLTGDANANTIDGGDGNDTIKGGAGNDILAGGEGIDTLSYDDSPTRVIVNLFNTSTITIGGITVDPGHAFDGFTPPPVPFPAPTDTVSDFEIVIGSAFGDHIQGTTNVANVLFGGAGNDTLAGSGASDGIFMPPMPPIPGAANDTLFGGAGNDVLRQSRGNDIIDGGEGTFDQLEFTNNGIFYGGAIGVNVNLAAGTSYADPNNGDAVHDAEGDKATISGIESVVGTAGNDVFVGGNPELDPVLSGSVSEFFRPLGGNDTITGMAGPGWSTVVDYSTNTSLQPVTVVLGNGNNMGTASDGFDSDPLTVGVQPYTDTLIEVDVVRGGAGDDHLEGGSYGQGASGVFVEAFRGNAGNDTIDGGGSDTVIGAYGVTDRAEYNSSPGPVMVNLATGTAFDGFGGTDTLIDINVVRGSNSSDMLVGGNPKFDNSERFEGLAGNDFIDGGSGNDEADYSSSTSPVIVNLGPMPFMVGLEVVAGGTARDGFGGTDTLVSVEWARGSSGNDTLIGGANALERFTGGAGDDSIDGGSMTGVNYASFVLGTSGAIASVANGIGTASNDGQGGSDMLVNINGLWGSNFADTLSGGAGDQWFIGEGGNDLINGGADTDTVSYMADPNGVTVNLAMNTATDGWGGIWGLQGTDTLISIENVEGSSFNDTLTGDANANTIDGGDGNDTIKGGAGNDILAGGEGIDTLSYDDSPTRVIVNLFNTSTITIGGITVDPGHAFDGFTPPPVPFPAPTDTVSDFEIVIGSAFGDHIQGTTNVANVLFGGAGNDTLAGSGASDGIFMPPMPPIPGAANDTLFGGAGNDVLRQSRGNDIIDGGEGTFDQLEFTNNGIFYGGAIGVNVNLAAGTSYADPNNGDAVHDAEGDKATISGIESVVGTAGNDVFVGGNPELDPVLSGSVSEFFRPLGGNDTITGMAGPGWSTVVDYSTNTSLQPVTVVLGNGNNMGTASDGFDSDPLTVGVQPYTDTLIEVDVVRGGAGDDHLEGGSYGQGASGVFVEAFRGNAGNDTIDGGGSDTVIGAYGVTDRAEYNSSPGPVMVNLATGTAFDGFGGTDTLIDINVVRGSNSSDMLVGGNPKFDNSERFEGLAGNDFIDGGSGNDEADYSSSTSPVIVNLGPMPFMVGLEVVAGGTARDGFGGTDTLVSVEWARGSSGNDTLIGGANALERFTGGAGDDSIDGGSMTGVNYASFVLGTSGAIASVANGIGTASNDGQGGSDMLVNINGLWGSNFADTLSGGAGDQWFIGEGGNDLINGGADTDTVSYMADPNGVTVNLAMNTATDGWGGIWGLQGTDTLISIENVEGSSFNDTLTGDANANIINGRGGMDTLTGGANADVFKFGLSASNNTVTDFDDDVLDFSTLFTAAGVIVPPGEDPLEWLVIQGYLITDSTANVGGGAANDTVVQVDLDGSGGPGADYTVVTLTDVTLGTTGSDADNWLV